MSLDLRGYVSHGAACSSWVPVHKRRYVFVFVLSFGHRTPKFLGMTRITNALCVLIRALVAGGSVLVVLDEG